MSVPVQNAEQNACGFLNSEQSNEWPFPIILMDFLSVFSSIYSNLALTSIFAVTFTVPKSEAQNYWEWSFVVFAFLKLASLEAVSKYWLSITA
ncbi:hypothetical protein AYI69_g2510 [Smittium culicis]|uniref:Uncharacterized protein n=1 Tax=Smittium culicis TaxID=133412 RepID=A0A1R1YM74_9FUNG|nr:hypothetical protein AYI69_g2510 [Smittium culicis]